MRRNKFGRRRRRFWKFFFKAFVCFAVVLFVGLFLFFEKRISPFMSDYTVMKGKQTMTELFAETVNQKMTEMNLKYSDLIEITYSDSGEIQSLNTDVVTINKLKNEVTADLSKKLSQEYEFKAEIPIGSLINSEFLSGSGKSLEFNNIVTGDVKSDFRSEFDPAGINQTIHRLYFDITGDLIIICGGTQEPIELTTAVLVGETVIVGNVPNVNSGLSGSLITR